jgi:hypothetical protein
MTTRNAVLGSRGRLLAGLATAALFGSGLVQAAPNALSAPDLSCPDAYPVSDLAADQLVTGLTVTKGVTPAEFDGKIIGVLHDGIAPGIDMIMAELHSDQIDKTGIWQGMSGSPVYSEDNRLIGAVSYGLAFGPSEVAGITPAADMQALLDAGVAKQATLDAAKQTRRVDVTDKQAAAISRQTDVSAAQADNGFARLRMPLLVSGNRARLNHAAKALGMKNVHAFGGTTSSALAAPSDIVAGGNLAATESYGDLTSGGIGTATAVCGDQVVAFGHPMFFSGASQLTMHGADALYIQTDPTLAGFKVANITGPAGSILGDHRAGISGVVGTMPDTTTVSAQVSTVDGASRDGVTNISVPDSVPGISAFHLLTDEDRVFDQLGAGTARVRWTVEGLREDGTPFEFSRVNRFASPFDITFETIFESYDQLSRIINNRFEDVTITDVSYRSLLDPEYRAYRLGRVERRVGGEWVKLSRHNAARINGGSVMHLRVELRPVDDSDTVFVPVNLQVPESRRRSFGSLQIAGGGSLFDRSRASSFEGLLDSLENATPNNAVVAALTVERRGPASQTTASSVTDQVVQGRFEIGLRIV